MCQPSFCFILCLTIIYKDFNIKVIYWQFYQLPILNYTELHCLMFDNLVKPEVEWLKIDVSKLLDNQSFSSCDMMMHSHSKKRQRKCPCVIVIVQSAN